MKKNKPKIFNKSSVFIDKSVKFGKNVVVYQNNIIKGKTVIEDNVVIGPSNYICNCKIKKGAWVEFSYLEDSEVGICAKVGPFSRLRKGSKIKENAKIGNFVEVKNSVIGKKTKANHHAYIGDAKIGDNCNIGCGTIFVNYNGKTKQETKVGDNCFIGSNCNIIAPVEIADNCYICAGSTLTKNTSPYDFVIARSKETIKPNYSKKYLNKEQ